LALSKDISDGWLVMDKPRGITSRTAVDHAARWFPRGTAIGHTGTLDPLATGILVIAVGKATRLAEFVQDMTKTYTATVTLGAKSATDDAEGPIELVPNAIDPGCDSVERALANFIGVIQQTPPMFSAAKIDGRRAYSKARSGSAVLPTAKLVRIDVIEMLAYQYPDVRVLVRCGKGTYIRSLARDLGVTLGVGAFISALRRESVGEFDSKLVTPWDSPVATLLPWVHGLRALPRIVLTESEVRKISTGQYVQRPGSPPSENSACFDESGSLVAIVEVSPDDLLRPIKVFALP
jgi:tRNA pseudouridine55 synthase